MVSPIQLSRKVQNVNIATGQSSQLIDTEQEAVSLIEAVLEDKNITLYADLEGVKQLTKTLQGTTKQQAIGIVDAYLAKAQPTSQKIFSDPNALNPFQSLAATSLSPHSDETTGTFSSFNNVFEQSRHYRRAKA